MDMLCNLKLQKVTISQIIIPGTFSFCCHNPWSQRAACNSFEGFKALRDLALHGVLYSVAFSLLSNQYRRGICPTGGEKMVSFCFFGLQGASGSTAHDPSYPFWPGSVCFVWFYWANHCFAQWDCVDNMVLLLLCDIPDICTERLQRKDKSEMGMLQIDQAGGQNEEAHTELWE